MHMFQRTSRYAVISMAALILAACAGQKEPAQKLISDVESVVTSVFTEERGQTRLTVTCLYPSIEVRDMVMKTGMATGAGISYDRLEDIVEELQRT